MSEFVNTFPMDEDNRMLYPMNRDDYYNVILEAHKKWEEPKNSVEVIQVLLFNLQGELIVQKRSSTKKHNPNLLDKSIWWHIRVWDTPDHTVMLETVQELEVPSFVLHGRNEFLNKLTVLKEYLHTVWLIRYIDCEVHVFKQMFDEESVKVPKKFHLYFGVYGWSTRTVDREAKWILRYSLDEIDKEIEKYPNLYTDDFRFFLSEYREQINQFIEDILKFSKM